jgi:DNA polymerase-4
LPLRASILHVDLDAFYASVEQRDDPSLRGKPIIVGGPPPRGVVTAASYEARPFGVRSAIPTAQAMQLCPQLIVIPMDMERYAEASREFFAILDEFSPLVEGLSLDEAFLDVAGEERLLGDGPAIARRIKDRVRDAISLVASVGVAPSKFVAKIASDIDKPDGLRVVQPGEVLAFLHPLPVSRLWGVGKVTYAKLMEMGLATIGDIARYPEDLLRKRLGPASGAHLASLARGEDARSVVPDRGAVSIGHEQTFSVDLERRADVEPILRHQADRVAARLRRAKLRANVVAIKIKYANFKLVSRRVTLPDPTSDGSVIGKIAVELLRRVEITGDKGKTRSVRLCGVSASGLEDRFAAEQLTLDDGARRKGEVLGDVLDQIHEKYGNAAIGRAITHKHDA